MKHGVVDKPCGSDKLEDLRSAGKQQDIEELSASVANRVYG